MNVATESMGRWSESPTRWATLLVAMGLAVVLFWPGLVDLEDVWSKREEYSHAYFIPLLAIFFAWQKYDDLQSLSLKPSWIGLLVVAGGVFLFVAGIMSTIYPVVHGGFVVTVAGIVLAQYGWRGLRILWAPVIMLFLTIPLPVFLNTALSLKLQLISSEIGTALIRTFGISVFLEGNVIDLGNYKLQVADACSGLRYLFPLMSVSFIIAYLFDDAFWKRLVVFISAIPLTVLMNSLRVGVIGVLVEYWGTDMAEGFIHDFEGWIFFMFCTALLVLEVWILWRIGRNRRPFAETFGLYLPARSAASARAVRTISAPLVASILVLGVSIFGARYIDKRQTITPDRANLVDFPVRLGEWRGPPDRLEQIYLDELKLDDYLIADYRDSNGHTVNLHVAYFGDQKTRASVHSPRACLPGGGWEIRDISQKKVDGVELSGQPLVANRVKIQRGEFRQLVYYWFPQRGRVLTNEYLVKLYILIDSIKENRSDGAMVRLVTPVAPAETWEDADQRLIGFARLAVPKLEPYLPGRDI